MSSILPPATDTQGAYARSRRYIWHRKLTEGEVTLCGASTRDMLVSSSPVGGKCCLKCFPFLKGVVGRDA